MDIPSFYDFHHCAVLTNIIFAFNSYCNLIDISSTTISKLMQVKLDLTKIDDNTHNSTMNTMGGTKPSSGIRFLNICAHQHYAEKTHDHGMYGC